MNTRTKTGTHRHWVGWRQVLALVTLLAVILTGCIMQPQTGNGDDGGMEDVPTATPMEAEPTATPAEAEPTATPTEEPMETEVVMENTAFVPEELTVQAGTTVIWTNNDSFDHTVTAGTRGSPSGLFDETVVGGGTFSFTFEEPGAYDYYCSIHPGMEGVIVVE